jgi:hypothetical protein
MATNAELTGHRIDVDGLHLEAVTNEGQLITILVPRDEAEMYGWIDPLPEQETKSPEPPKVFTELPLPRKTTKGKSRTQQEREWREERNRAAAERLKMIEWNINAK